MKIPVNFEPIPVTLTKQQVEHMYRDKPGPRDQAHRAVWLLMLDGKAGSDAFRLVDTALDAYEAANASVHLSTDTSEGSDDTDGD